MAFDEHKAPFPYAGGKSKAAPLIWDLLGDPAHYVEPFAGSLATLLNRPHLANRPYFSETVNDADGLLVNAWRAIQNDPQGVAFHVSNPVAEADQHARHVALIRWREERQLEHLMGDPEFFDVRMGAWWIWGMCCWIGSGWTVTEGGPWWPDDDDRLTKWRKGDPERPHLDDHEPGVSRQIPHLADDGKGVNSAGLREPGVSRKRPHLGDNGMGVNSAGLREPGIEYHDIVMPKLDQWMRLLSARLRHVRIVNGDWQRVCTGGALRSLPVRSGKGHAGIFLDPPYSAAADRAEVYTVENFDVANDVRQWCHENGDNPEYRIVLAGYEGEGHETLEAAGWTSHEWYAKGHLTGGYGNANKERGSQQQRERLWSSPHCTTPQTPQNTLFDQAPLNIT